MPPLTPRSDAGETDGESHEVAGKAARRRIEGNRVVQFSPVNVYQMWAVSHEQPGGLWFRRTTWSNSIQ